MGALIIGLIAPALGILLSPLAIMALVAELLSRRYRANGLAFFIGWLLATVVVVGLSVAVFTAIDFHPRTDTPLWLGVIRLVIALGLIAAALWVYRRGGRNLTKMAAASTPEQVAAAAPQLPGWLQKVSEFTPGRSFALGFGIFAINPVDASCAIIAGLDIAGAQVTIVEGTVVAAGFVIVGVAPIAVPVFYVLARGEAAAPVLERLRGWIARHTNVLNAALILVIGVLQLQKAVSALV
ncbi:GAP family protein [Curtobacterium flaccumfaciens]|uniref:GAP family protein n=1 Tax=Curtobacterium flaccumfaciens TaxID=2035 RepID=UPI001BDDFBEC|nr:GAP family protein [Curtobacterium flaccumfaciens]MBT1671709.1 GAP family protein [Curtobacterium flaccumfaciens pv. flaccumfaciens]